MSDIVIAKRRAAEEALKRVSSLRPRIIGVGTGSTVDIFIDMLVENKDKFIGYGYVCASLYTANRLASCGFTVYSPGAVEEIDVYIDGADEVDMNLNMIKGGGGASTLEKILAYGSKYRIYIVDYTKVVKRLGEKHAIPVEVLPEALGIVCKRLRELGLNPSIRRITTGKYGFVVSDTRGVIVDVRPGKEFDPGELEKVLKSIPGVVETGLFIDLADEVIVGYVDRVEVLRKKGL